MLIGCTDYGKWELPVKFTVLWRKVITNDSRRKTLNPIPDAEALLDIFFPRMEGG